MIKIVDIRYVRLGTADVDRCVRFATETVGLELMRRENGTAYVRGDNRDHNICYFKGDPKDHTLGLEVATLPELNQAAIELQAAGVEIRWGSDAECTARRVMKFITFQDPTGNAIDLVVRPFHSGRRYFPTRDAGIQEFSHVGLRTSDAPRDEQFWTTLFNFRVNDWIGAAALLSFDKVHHRIALFPAPTPGVQHINFQVASTDDIMRSHYFLTDRQVRIVFGPGRHPSSTAQFLYFEGPDGVVYEYSHGVRLVEDPSYRPRQFPMENLSFCMWGAKPDIPEFRSDKK
jgi:2,3-dihydroxy-p-cumate/2,3-dihydroxybenzoate 3,4-dioxygenase